MARNTPTCGQRAEIDALVGAVRAGRSYRNIAPEFIRTVASHHYLKHESLKQSMKATRSALRELATAYFVAPPQYELWAQEIARAYTSGDRAVLKQVCGSVMSHHVSTGERLPFAEEFYRIILAGLPPVRSVLDVGCGLNPLSIPWMGLPPGCAYFAMDVFTDLAAFLQEWFSIAGIDGHSVVADICRSAPEAQVDVCLLLKLVPLLDRLGESCALRTLERIRARSVVVSFPVSSLGGRGKAVLAHNESRFHEMIRHETWSVRRFAFPTEVAFVLTRPGS